MSINKLALIRYKAIDECLGNRYRKWTLEDLIQKVADVLYDLEGISSGVSKRTIQADIQLMRSDKLGYNAPIIVKDRKYYSYSDPAYSITNAPINNADVDKMKEIVAVLKQFNGFSYFDDMSDMIARLENNLYKSTDVHLNCIQLENNHLLLGLAHINPLYQATLHKKALLIEYKSFKASKSQEYICYPYLLKEYRNRWFLITRSKHAPQLTTLALDRMVSIQELPKEKFIPWDGMPFDEYYDNLIGVTKSEKDPVHKVVLQIDKKHAPYVLTKPLHHSQQVLAEDESTTTLSIHVVLNFELEREIMGFGEHMKVIAPRLLVKKMAARLLQAAQMYDKS
ncbi:helix-turn-helix transcriptional regulator [Chitinophaga arvensicola]|uniref:Predicted DNA-binding transcriptional regulator YafY, contains an HTH and WYL domains n=1 Tax=Chitinophaga arvensicola TaxID=29529 RepID=A0A1I0S8U2_9BACT|nr:WYL domain-containing protein [Chitinophaga arvensicola]SEW52579.1 Predicted DNA-binding transcriptional regulator YafY, contains an HTH and WYL domains [Chitinophaga arvensicola]